MGRRKTRFGVATNHWEIEGVIGYLCLIGFIILIKICLKTRSWMRDGFRDLIMHGEGVSIPWHPSKDGYLLPCVHACDQANVGFIILVQMSWCFRAYINWWWTHFHAIGIVILCSPLIILYLLGFLVKQWQGILETLTLFTWTKFGWFGHDQDLICPWVARAK